MKVFFTVHKLALLVCSRHRVVCRGTICPAMSSNVGGLPLTRPIRTGVPLRNPTPMPLAETLGLEMLSFGECCRNGVPSSLPLINVGVPRFLRWSCLDGCRVFYLIWALSDLTLFQGILPAAYSHVIFRSTMDIHMLKFVIFPRLVRMCIGAVEIWSKFDLSSLQCFPVLRRELDVCSVLQPKHGVLPRP